MHVDARIYENAHTQNDTCTCSKLLFIFICNITLVSKFSLKLQDHNSQQTKSYKCSFFSKWTGKITKIWIPRKSLLQQTIAKTQTHTYSASSQNHLTYRPRNLVNALSLSFILSPSPLSEQYHGPALTEFVDWCNNSFLDLNVTKTKEMMVDFRRQEHSPGKTIIHYNKVETVGKYKYLATICDDELKWDDNTEEIVSLAKAKLFLCWSKHSNAFFSSQIFYWEWSVIHFHLLVHSLGVKNRNSLQRIVRITSKITAEPETDLALFCEQQILRKAHSILTKKDHILNQEFATLPSGRRRPICKMNRFKNSFMPVVVRLLNNTWNVYVYMKYVYVCVCVWLCHSVCVWHCFNCCVWYFNYFHYITLW